MSNRLDHLDPTLGAERQAHGRCERSWECKTCVALGARESARFAAYQNASGVTQGLPVGYTAYKERNAR